MSVKSGYKFFNTLRQLDPRLIKTKKFLTRLDNVYVVGAKKLHEKPINNKVKRRNLCLSEFTCFQAVQ